MVFTHQLRFSPLLSVSTYLIISLPVEKATLCRYREMMLRKESELKTTDEIVSADRMFRQITCFK